MICNFIVVLFFEKKINRYTEEQQCKVNLADEYHRNLGPAEVSGSLVGFYRAKISFGVLTVICMEGKGEVAFSQSPRSLTVLVEYAD